MRSVPMGEFRKSKWIFPDGFAPLGCTALHAGALLGILEIMVSLLETNKWDLNAIDEDGNTALSLATRRQHDTIVKMLLGQEGIDPNIVDFLGRTPLS